MIFGLGMGYRNPEEDMPTLYRKVDSTAGVVLYAFAEEETKTSTKQYDAGIGRGIGVGKMGGLTVVPLSETDLSPNEESDWTKVR